MRKFLTGFWFAYEGLRYAFKTQVNFRFHALVSLLVMGMGFLLDVNKTEWLFILLCIGFVVSAELFNTSLEKLTDLVTTQMHPLAKAAKDCAAAGVLIAAITSAVVGIFIFLPYIIDLFARYINQ